LREVLLHLDELVLLRAEAAALERAELHERVLVVDSLEEVPFLAELPPLGRLFDSTSSESSRSSDAFSTATRSRDARIPTSGTIGAVENPQQSHRYVTCKSTLI
jgi:hypothetical protein